jgi:hypothetical protein
MDVRPPLVADAEAPELVQPGQCSLHHPPMDAQATAMSSEALRQDWFNPQGAQHLPMGFRAIGSVSLNSVWPTAWPASLATHRRNGCHQGQQLGHIMTVGSGQNGGQGDSLGVGNDVVLAAGFAPVSGIGSRFSPHPQPPGWTHYPQQLGTNRSGQPLAVWPAVAHEVSAKPPLPATPIGVASRSCQSRTPSPGVTSPTESHSSRRRGCRLAPAGCPGAFVQGTVAAWVWAAAGVVESVPIVRRLPVASACISPWVRRNYYLPRIQDKANSSHFVSSS